LPVFGQLHLRTPEIWGDRNNVPAVYLHRIAVHEDFSGKQLVSKIILWAKVYALKNRINFIGMDTVGGNKKLIAHYQ
jgi:hypothetical protein